MAVLQSVATDAGGLSFSPKSTTYWRPFVSVCFSPLYLTTSSLPVCSASTFQTIENHLWRTSRKLCVSTIPSCFVCVPQTEQRLSAKNTKPTLFSLTHFGFSCHHSVHIWMDSSAILWSMTETSQGWESTFLHPTYQAAQNVQCSVVRQHNGQKRADNWSKGWMQNAAAGKQHLRKTQQNCSHTSTRVVVPNNHSASVVDRYTQEKIPSYIHIHIHRRNTHGCAHSQSLSDSAPFHSLPFFFFFLTKCCCTIFTKKWTLKITQQQPNTTPCCWLSEDKGNTLLIYKSWGKCCCVNWTASLHWWYMTVLGKQAKRNHFLKSLNYKEIVSLVDVRQPISALCVCNWETWSDTVEKQWVCNLEAPRNRAQQLCFAWNKNTQTHQVKWVINARGDLLLAKSQ